MLRFSWKFVVSVTGLLFVYFYNLSAIGLINPDEPRYASIGRAMAQTGDWIVPKLWGKPWFEKPALLYWLIGGGYKAGLGDDLAARVPIVLISVAFLCFFYYRMKREFGNPAAYYASAILATCAGWLAFSQVAVTDLPMAAAFSTAMFLCFPWLRSGGRRGLFIAGLMLGLAVLAKGLVPLVLTIPLLWVGRKHITDLWALILGCLITAAPWYLLCAQRSGQEFLVEFFWRHHFDRFASGALLHVQPFWFYLPVLLASLFPWTPALCLLYRWNPLKDPRHLLLALWTGFGLVFFSIATNKLPGYLLPLLPAVAAVMGIRLAEVRNAAWVLAASALLLILVAPIADILPVAISSGISRSTWPIPGPAAIAFAISLALICWLLDRRSQRGWAVTVFTGAIAACILYLKATTFPELDALASARAKWKQMQESGSEVCASDLPRGMQYGLNFYANRELAGCKPEL